jgi:hypothetical protein
MHTWIAGKPSGAPRYARYEVLGGGAPYSIAVSGSCVKPRVADRALSSAGRGDLADTEALFR